MAEFTVTRTKRYVAKIDARSLMHARQIAEEMEGKYWDLIEDKIDECRDGGRVGVPTEQGSAS